MDNLCIGDIVSHPEFSEYFEIVHVTSDSELIECMGVETKIRHKWLSTSLIPVSLNGAARQQMINKAIDEIGTEDKVTHATGATSSFCHDFAQIPLIALISLAKRFELGAKKHGRDNWRSGLHDKSYVIERLNHVIYHCYKLINKLEGKIPFDNDDDAGGILWGGAFASEAVKLHHPQEQEKFL